MKKRDRVGGERVDKMWGKRRKKVDNDQMEKDRGKARKEKGRK